ncbi:MAG: LOG family protein [Phycisphaerales bacterium]|nr:LOG family protein [Phycisphaerales bacterium]
MDNELNPLESSPELGALRPGPGRPATVGPVPAGAGAPAPVGPAAVLPDDPAVQGVLDGLIAQVGGRAGSFDARLIRDLMTTALKLVRDGRHTGEIKLITNSVKELRHAYRVFARFAEPHKVTVFGSARTPEGHPDYEAAVEYSRLMAGAGWMVITGAGGGIMQAGHVGPGREASFGVAIRLPFEQSTNSVIEGDEKLIHFRYFFTRKLMFVSQAEAVALFPGGFGTMDEAYETLTLVQTGKSGMIPIVCLEGAGGTYWKEWDQWVRNSLLARGWISPEDPGLYYLAKDPRDAFEHVTRFYRMYHSSRYVKDDLVIRLNNPISAEVVDRLNREYGALVKEGKIVQRGALDLEDDHRQLPRLVFRHTRSRLGLLRKLIDEVNQCEPAQGW